MPITNAHELVSSRSLRFGSIALASSLILWECAWSLSTDNSRPIEGTSTKTTNSAKPASIRVCYESFLEGRMDLVEEKVACLQQELPEDVHHWNYGNVYHQYMTMSGLLALGKDDDLERAQGFLALAGQTPGSPQLNSFGPNMLLARALLERGEFNCVEVYLEQCKSFWVSGVDKLDAWRSQIQERRMPDFGANLTF